MSPPFEAKWYTTNDVLNWLGKMMNQTQERVIRHEGHEPYKGKSSDVCLPVRDSRRLSLVAYIYLRARKY